MKRSRVHNAAASGTQYTTRAFVRGAHAGFSVTHPAATTTTYTVEASVGSGAEVRRGAETYFTYDAVTIPAKSAAETFGVDLSDFPHPLVRLKMVTSAGTGTIVVDFNQKDG